MSDTIDDALDDLKETLRITREEIGRERAFIYPEWLDEDLLYFGPDFAVQP